MISLSDYTSSPVNYPVIMRITSDGDMVWQTAIPPTVAQVDVVYSVAEASGGDIITLSNINLIRLHSDGTVRWSKTSIYLGNACLLGVDDQDNSYFSYSDPGPYCGVVKHDSDGNIVWNTSYASTPGVSPAYDIEFSAIDNTVVMVSVNQPHIIIIMKLSTIDGSVIWANSLDYGESTGVIAFAAVVDDIGNIYVSGQANTGLYGFLNVVLDIHGSPQWSNIFTGTSSSSYTGEFWGNGFGVVTLDGTQIISVGYTNNGVANNNYAALILNQKSDGSSANGTWNGFTLSSITTTSTDITLTVTVSTGTFAQIDAGIIGNDPAIPSNDLDYNVAITQIV